MSRFNYYMKNKKPFSKQDILKDIDFSIFVTRLYFTKINFNWVSVEVDGIKKGNIQKYVDNLKTLGYIATTNFTKLPENLVECLNSIHPNYYSNVDVKTTKVYLRTETLFRDKDLINQIKNKWGNNETYLVAYKQQEREFETYKYLMDNIKLINSTEDKRIKKFPNGVEIEVETTKKKKELLLYKQICSGTDLVLKDLNTQLMIQKKQENEKLRTYAKSINLQSKLNDDIKEIDLFNKNQSGIDREADKLNKEKLENFKKIKHLEDTGNPLDVFSDMVNSKVITEKEFKENE